MKNFSDELIQKLINYFLKKYGIDVSKKEAEQYLNIITEFYIALVDEK